MPEFPCLSSGTVNTRASSPHNHGGQPTSRPYGDSPLSSLCLTLWKSYLFNWRTKLAKLLCLKCFGRIVLVNFSFCRPGEISVVERCRSSCGASGPQAYLQDHKAVAVGAPSYYRVVRGILEHPATSWVSMCCPAVGARRRGVQRTCRVCAPGDGMLVVFRGGDARGRGAAHKVAGVCSSWRGGRVAVGGRHGCGRGGGNGLDRGPVPRSKVGGQSRRE
jgi:hypothetical protein